MLSDKQCNYILGFHEDLKWVDVKRILMSQIREFLPEDQDWVRYKILCWIVRRIFPQYREYTGILPVDFECDTSVIKCFPFNVGIDMFLNIPIPHEKLCVCLNAPERTDPRIMEPMEFELHPQTFAISTTCYKNIEKRVYQQNAIRACINSQHACNIVVMPFASGKTYIQTQIAKYYPGSVIYVINDIVRYQTQKLLRCLHVSADVRLYDDISKCSTSSITTCEKNGENVVIYDDYNMDLPRCENRRCFYFTAIKNIDPRLGEIIHETECAQISQYLCEYEIIIKRCTNISDWVLSQKNPRIFMGCNLPYKQYLYSQAISIDYGHPIYYITDDMDKKAKLLFVDEFKNIGGIICSDILSSGIDIDCIDCVVVLSAIYDKSVLQIIGRGLRKHEKKCQIVLVYEKHISELSHILSLLSMYDRDMRNKISKKKYLNELNLI